MKRLIKNIAAIVAGCTLIYGVNSYLIPFNTEDSAIAFSAMALVVMGAGFYGIANQVIGK